MYNKKISHDRGWDGWMASPTQWTWVWVGTGKPGVLQSMGSQSWTWLSDWTELITKNGCVSSIISTKLEPSFKIFFFFGQHLALLVQPLSPVRLFATPWTEALQATLSFTTSRSLLKLMSIESVMHPTISSSVIPFSSCLQSFPASGSFLMSQLFTSGGQSFGASASSIEYSRLISFRIDRFDPLAVQGTLKRLLQHHSSKASILWHSAFFMDQLLNPYMTTGKNHSFDWLALLAMVWARILRLICCTGSSISNWFSTVLIFCVPTTAYLARVFPTYKWIYFILRWALAVAQPIKNVSEMRETWVWSLGQEDSLEKGMATHSSILA